LHPISELINRGSIAEAFVGQELLAYSTPIKKAHLYYWQRMAREGNAKVDYLVQDDEHIIPIEVKSGTGSTLASMHSFLESHPKSPYGIRFSTNNYSVYNRVHSYPLYAIAQSLHSFEDLMKKIV
jgi:predicted AAA+ superfamily ATPase